MPNVTHYSVLYDGVLSKIKDYEFANMMQEEVYAILVEYIRPAIVKFIDCRQDLSLRDDDAGMFLLKLTDYEIEILVNFMLIEYLDANYIRIPSLLKVSMSSKDFNQTSLPNHLNRLQSLRDKCKKENEQLMIDYSYITSSLFEVRT